MKRLLLLILFIPEFSSSQIITTVAGVGIAGFSGDGGLAITAKFNWPNSLAFDKAGNMYICDGNNNRIRKINTFGIITTVAGNGVLDYSGDNGLATSAALFGPISLLVDSYGNLYISTSGDARIRKVNTSGIISTIAGSGTSGYNGDEITATSAELINPYLGAIDKAGNLLFSDNGNHRVRKINTSGIITTIAGNGIYNYAGDGGPATAAELKGPGWLSINALGELYIPDNYSHCVRKINLLGIISTFAGTGIAGWSGDEYPASSATLAYPNCVAIDHIGNAYIADFAANVVRKVDTFGIITTIAGTGVPGYVAVNASGNVFIADINNNRIRKITYHPEAVNNIVKPQNIVSIYPNPANDEITVNANEKIEHVMIINLIGQTIFNQSYSKTDKTAIDISGYPNGIYFVKVNGIYGGKFVKE